MNHSDPGLETPPRLQRPLPLRQAPLRRPPLGLPDGPALQDFVERGVVAAGPRTKVTVELVSRRSAEVAVSLEPGANLAAPQTDWLTPETAPAAGAPGSLALYSEPGQVHLRLTLADPPPPGRHEACLTDSQGQAWGSGVLIIAPHAAP